MPHSSRLAGWTSLALGVSFAIGATILITIEPEMGFSTMADYWNPELVVPALNSIPWLVSDVCHMLNGILLIILSSTFATAHGTLASLLRASGTVSGAFFVLVAMLDRVGARMPELIQDPETLSVLSIAFISTRMGALLAAVFTLGGFIVLMSAESLRERWYAAWFSYFGFVVGALAIVFFVLPSPIPIPLSLWAIALGVFLLRNAPREERRGAV